MRVRTGPYRRRKHKKILARTKGFRLSKHRRIKVAKEADLHAGDYAFAGRKLRKRDFRKLWIQRINAGLEPHGLKYSQFIAGLKKKKIALDRKILSDLALTEPKVFSKILTYVKHRTK